MQCPNCGAENRAIARFCQHCGAALPPVEPEQAEAATAEGQAIAEERAEATEQIAALEQVAITEQFEAEGETTVEKQAAAEEQVVTGEQLVAEEGGAAEGQAVAEEEATGGQAAIQGPAAIEEQPLAQEQAGISEQALVEEQAPTGQAAPTEPAVSEEQFAAPEPVVCEDQAVVEGQVATAEQAVAEERAGGGEDVGAEEAALVAQPGSPVAEATAIEVAAAGGAAPGEQPAADEVEAGMPDQDVGPESGALEGTAGDVQAAGEAAAQPAEQPPTEGGSAEADLLESDLLPWRDEPSPSPMLEPGTVLDGRYRIVERLSTDQAGALYAARDLRRCPQCGFEENSPDQAFCTACGAVLDQKPLVRVLEHAPGQDLPPDVEVLDHVVEGERAYWVLKEPGKQTDVLGGSEEPMRLEVGQRTHPGQTRELDEDSLLTLTLTRTFESHESASALFVVADGMGGHEAGEVASRIAIRALADALLRDVFARELAGAEVDDDAIETALRRAVQLANEQVFLERERRENDMGTTVTAALLRDWTLFIAHVGDCRAYRWGKDGLQQLTTDHSVIASMVASGAAQPEEVYTHPHRSVIYRSVGDQPSVEVDTAVLSVEPGDRLVLCCDGLWEMLRDDGIEEVLLREADPQRACDVMVEQANEAGGPDNISVIVVQL